MCLQRSERCVSCLTVLFYERLSGMQVVIPLARKAIPKPVVKPLVGQQPFGHGKFIRHGGSTSVIVVLPRRYDQDERGDYSDPLRHEALVLIPPFVRPIRRTAPPFTRRLEAVRYALR